MCIAPGAVRSSPLVRGRSLILLVVSLVGVLGIVASACSSGSDTKAKGVQPSTTATTAAPTTTAPTTAAKIDNVYQYTQANQLAPSVRDIPSRVYVPNAMSNPVDVIDPNTMIASCEFSGFLVRIDLDTMAITGELNVGGKPVDIKLSPDGSLMFNANETKDGVTVVDWANMREVQFIPTAKGAHGLYPSRNGKQLYVTNRGAGSVSVIDFASRNVAGTWQFGGSPDMGGLSSDGKQLWLSGRYNSEVYVIDTTKGQLNKKIPVCQGTHGLALFPQPGRFSMGHTGNYR